MTRLQFWTLNLASLLLAATILFEIRSSDQLDLAQDRTREAQAPLLRDQQAQPVARRLVERIAQGAPADPALKDLLVKYGFQVSIKPLPSHP